MEKKAYIMIGCPGSGKSWYVEQNKLPFVSRDRIRIDLGFCQEGEKYLGTPLEEKRVTEEHERQILDFAKKGISFAVDDTNVNKVFREILLSRLKNLGYTTVGVKIDTKLETCIKRRDSQIPVGAIRNMYVRAQLVEPSEFDEWIVVKGE